MSPDEEIEKLREVFKILGEGLPQILNSIADLSYDPKRVAAFATSTAEFYKQLREAGVPEDKAAELTKAFMERSNPMGPLGGLFGGAGVQDLDDLLGKAGKADRKFVFKVKDRHDEEKDE
jgi:hypothetical protein